MTETCKTLIKLPSAPAYGVPVVRRELRIRFRGEHTAQVVVPESLAATLDLPKGKRCIVELVNVLDAEGSVEQDRLDFVVGEKKWSLGGMAADPIEPPPATKKMPPPAAPVAAEAATDEQTEATTEPAEEMADESIP